MKGAWPSIIALLIAVFFMVMGSGILGTIIPLSAKAHGFGPAEIGLLGSAYFGGMLFGAVIATRALQRIGHVRVLTACMVLGASSTLGLALYPDLWLWLALRFLIGLAFAGLYATIESWLQGKAEDSIRGRVLSTYSVVQFAGWGLGNQLIGIADPMSFVLFSIASITMCIAILPLVLPDIDPPAPPSSNKMDLMGVWRRSPIGVVGALLIGSINGPFWSLTPIFASEAGLSIVQVGTFMTMLTLGSALMQFPVGKWSDAMDRRTVLVSLALACALFELALAYMGAPKGFAALLAVGFALGGLISTQYYVVSAHSNDRSDPGDTVRISAALLLLYCIGAVIGPTTAAFVMKLYGPAGLHLHNGVLHLVLAAFVVYRMMKRPPPKPGEGDSLPIRPSI